MSRRNFKQKSQYVFSFRTVWTGSQAHLRRFTWTGNFYPYTGCGVCFIYHLWSVFLFPIRRGKKQEIPVGKTYLTLISPRGISASHINTCTCCGICDCKIGQLRCIKIQPKIIELIFGKTHMKFKLAMATPKLDSWTWHMKLSAEDEWTATEGFWL